MKRFVNKNNIINLIITILIFTMFLSIGSTAKAASSDTTLKSLSIEPSGTGLVQDEENNKVYRVKVDNNITSVIVKAETNNANATVSVSGNTSLVVGTNKVTVKVTAEDGTSENYIIYVRRADTPISGETIVPNVQDNNEQELNINGDEKEDNENQNEEENIANEITNENIDNIISSNLENIEENTQVINNNSTNSENASANSNSKKALISIIVVIILIVIIAIMSKKKRK
ncbi:MAG: cadherin-like beta sandwich domain-containing protein [Clostridia bacterium]